MGHRIGIAVITCNREDLFRRCASSLPAVDRVLVVNDGAEYDSSSYPGTVSEIVQHRRNLGVGRSKNEALQLLLDGDCDHLFLCEDDIVIADQRILERYIHAAGLSGIHHFNYGYHGPMNKNATGNPAPRLRREYHDNTTVVLNRHLVGAFSYYTQEIIRRVGLMDTFYRNAYEHVDHTYRIIRSGGHPPFGWFADIEGSDKAILDLDPSLERSIIRRNDTVQRVRMKVFSLYFKLKNGGYPWELTGTLEPSVDRWLHEHGRVGNL